MIFAREITPDLTSLVKKIDAATVEHEPEHMGSFVVFLSDDEGLDKKLKALGEKEKLKETVLAIDNVAGPKGHKVAKDAAITVVMYTEREVKANYAFKKGEMKASDIDAILKDVAKILPRK